MLKIGMLAIWQEKENTSINYVLQYNAHHKGSTILPSYLNLKDAKKKSTYFYNRDKKVNKFS